MKLWKITLIVVLTLVVVPLMISFFIPEDTNYGQELLPGWKDKNKVLLTENENLDSKVKLLSKKVDSLTLLIKTNNKTITTLKINLNEKITTISSYSDAELYLYFSGFKTDSTAHKN